MPGQNPEAEDQEPKAIDPELQEQASDLAKQLARQIGLTPGEFSPISGVEKLLTPEREYHFRSRVIALDHATRVITALYTSPPAELLEIKDGPPALLGEALPDAWVKPKDRVKPPEPEPRDPNLPDEQLVLMAQDVVAVARIFEGYLES